VEWDEIGRRRMVGRKEEGGKKGHKPQGFHRQLPPLAIGPSSFARKTLKAKRGVRRTRA
jgi:hypothetical protein